MYAGVHRAYIVILLVLVHIRIGMHHMHDMLHRILCVVHMSTAHVRVPSGSSLRLRLLQRNHVYNSKEGEKIGKKQHFFLRFSFSYNSISKCRRFCVFFSKSFLRAFVPVEIRQTLVALEDYWTNILVYVVPGMYRILTPYVDEFLQILLGSTGKNVEPLWAGI